MFCVCNKKDKNNKICQILTTNIQRCILLYINTLHLQEPNWPPLISHFQPLHVGKRIQPLNVEKRFLYTPVNTSIYRWKQFKRETFIQLAHYQGHHFQHYLSKIGVPSAPFDTPGLSGNDPTACTLWRKKKRIYKKEKKKVD